MCLGKKRKFFYACIFPVDFLLFVKNIPLKYNSLSNEELFLFPVASQFFFFVLTKSCILLLKMLAKIFFPPFFFCCWRAEKISWLKWREVFRFSPQCAGIHHRVGRVQQISAAAESISPPSISNVAKSAERSSPKLKMPAELILLAPTTPSPQLPAINISIRATS